MKCPYCDGLTQLRDNIIIYKTKSYGMAYVCENYPDCDAYVGCHPGSSKPLGTLADAELRRWRNKTHAELDPLWKGPLRKMSRNKAYELGAKLLNVKEFHVGWCELEDCKTLVSKLQKYKQGVLTLL
jgi:ssDNA-binding Zn-finger/Zn-ribbon topoisomerase 1